MMGDQWVAPNFRALVKLLREMTDRDRLASRVNPSDETKK
jgi:hypothetical protein